MKELDGDVHETVTYNCVCLSGLQTAILGWKCELECCENMFCLYSMETSGQSDIYCNIAGDTNGAWIFEGN